MPLPESTLINDVKSSSSLPSFSIDGPSRTKNGQKRSYDIGPINLSICNTKRQCSNNSSDFVSKESDDDKSGKKPTSHLEIQTRNQKLEPHVVRNKIADVLELESSAIKNGSARLLNFTPSNGKIIGDGGFEIVGDGKECKAVGIERPSMYSCLILNHEEYRKFMIICERLNKNWNHYSENTFREIRNYILPEDSIIIQAQSGVCYLLLPDHYGYLHSIERAYNIHEAKRSFGSEQLVQPIFKNIVRIVEFCHKAGLYFGDFRLRKFVFLDKDRSVVRVSNILDLSVLPDNNCDSIVFRDVCPAYVSPEILEKRGIADGKLADIWALGVLLFVLLNGRYPFYECSNNPLALFRRIRLCRFTFPINNNISESAKWLIHALLRQNPDERPSCFVVLNSHWIKSDPKLIQSHNSLCPNSRKITNAPNKQINLESSAQFSPFNISDVRNTNSRQLPFEVGTVVFPTPNSYFASSISSFRQKNSFESQKDQVVPVPDTSTSYDL